MAVNPLVQRALSQRINQGQPTDTLKMQEALGGAERSAASAWESLSGGGSPVVNARPTFNPMTAGRSAMDAMQGLLGKFRGITGGLGSGSKASAGGGLLGGLMGGSTSSGASTSASALQNQMRAAAAQRGWSGAEWDALKFIIDRESSWRPDVKNPTSSAWGLFQFLDMHKKPGGYLPHGNNSTIEQQIAGGLRYIAERYGSPTQAAAFHRRKGWY